MLQISLHTIRLTAFVRRAAAGAGVRIITQGRYTRGEKGRKIKAHQRGAKMKNVCVCVCLSTLSDDGYSQFVASVVSACVIETD